MRASVVRARMPCLVPLGSPWHARPYFQGQHASTPCVASSVRELRCDRGLGHSHYSASTTVRSERIA
eukprot:365313-Chlamydomonas_euryale.AAC.17